MAIYTFDSDAQGWSGSSFAWTGSDGNPAAGCITKTGTFGTALVSITGLSIAVGTADALEFYTKYSGSLAVGSGILQLECKDSGGTVLNSVCRVVGGFDAGSDVWQQGISTGGFTPGTVTTLELSAVGSNTLTALSFDSVYVVDVPTAGPSAGDDTRILGIEADNAYIYRTEILGGYNYFQYYEIAGTAAAGSAVFGTTTYTAPDSFTGGLYPAPNYGSDKQIYLRGSDAAGRVLYADLNGTAGFSDVGAGTVWNGKFCVALMIDPMAADDIVAIFYDNDVYSTTGSTINWGTKFGDVTGTIVTASRNPTDAANILAGALSGGSIYYSSNYGESFVSGGTVGGTARWIEFNQ